MLVKKSVDSILCFLEKYCISLSQEGYYSGHILKDFMKVFSKIIPKGKSSLEGKKKKEEEKRRRRREGGGGRGGSGGGGGGEKEQNKNNNLSYQTLF